MKKKNQKFYPRFNNFIKGGLTVLISVLIIFTVVKASTDKITPPSGTPVATFYSLSEIYEFIASSTAATVGSPALDFSGALEDTGRTLTEIYSALASLIDDELVKKDTIYLGVTGTLVPSGGDATTTDVCASKKYFGDSQTNWNLQTGALTIDAAKVVSGTSYCGTDGTFASTTETATTTGVDITPPAGTWFSKITVAITNLIAEYIKKDMIVGGVTGSLVPSDGTAVPTNVATGTTFFGASQSNWTPQTGTFDPWTPQWLQTRDDWVSNEGTSNEYILEEAVWTTVTGSPFEDYDGINYEGDSYTLNLFSGAVKRDERTGLWWSDIAASTGPTAATSTNSFTNGAVDGVRPTTGHAVLFCNALNAVNFAGYNNWYLPTQKELMQAYIDGSANNLVRPGYGFWSSSEDSWASTRAWAVYLHSGTTGTTAKASPYHVRCVRR